MRREGRAGFLSVIFAFLAAAGVSGCDEEKLSKPEFERAYGEATRPLYEASAGTPIVLGKKPYSVERGRSVMARLAMAHRSVSDKLESLNPPSNAESAVAAIIKSLRDRATRDQRAADNPALTEQQFRDAICCTPPAFIAAEEDLIKLGYSAQAITKATLDATP